MHIMLMFSLKINEKHQKAYNTYNNPIKKLKVE